MQIARGATATFHTRCEAMNLAVLLRGSCTRVGYLHSWHAQRSALSADPLCGADLPGELHNSAMRGLRLGCEATHNVY